jgi:hypothetical protein
MAAEDCLMHALHLPDGTGLPPAFDGRFAAEELPHDGSALWLVRDVRSGSRCWFLLSQTEDASDISIVTHILRSSSSPHLPALIESSTEAGSAYACLQWQGERQVADTLTPGQREWTALQLLDCIHLLQAMPEPVSLPQLGLGQLLVLPLTGYLRLADLSGAIHNASVEALLAGRQACAAVLRALLGEQLAPEAGLLGAWENDGAESYPQLRAAIQRLQLAALTADF